MKNKGSSGRSCLYAAGWRYFPDGKRLFLLCDDQGEISRVVRDILCAAGLMVGLPFVEKRWVMVGIYALFYGLNGLNNGPANVFEAEVRCEADVEERLFTFAVIWATSPESCMAGMPEIP